MTAPPPHQAQGNTPSRQSSFAGQLLALGVFPVALVPRSLFSWPDPALWRPLVVYTVLILVWGAVSGAFRSARTWIPGWPVWLFLIALLGLQGVAAWASAMHWKYAPIEAIGTYGYLLVQVVVLLLYALGLRLLCSVPGAAAALVWGAVASLAVLLGICCMQLAWLFTGPEVWHWLTQGLAQPQSFDRLGSTVAGVHAHLGRCLGWMGTWLEAPMPLPQSASSGGAYTLTALRIHGVFATASDLAVTLATAYIPLLLAGFAVAGPWGRRLFGLLAAVVVIVLLGGRTPATAVACVFTVAWLGQRILWKPGGRIRALLVIGLVLALCAGGLSSDSTSHRIVSRVLEPGAPALPEEVVAGELWSLVQEHPWTGVGYGWSSSYVINGEQYLRSMRTESSPELRAWREDSHRLPTPSLLLEFLAVFGVPLALASMASFLWLWLRLRRLAGADIQQRFALAGCVPYSTAVALFALFDADWNNPLLILPFILLWGMAGVWSATSPAPAKSGPPGSSAGSPSGEGKAPGPVQSTARSGPLISDSPTRPFTLSDRG